MFQRLTALGIAVILSAGMYAQHDSISSRTHAIDEVTVTAHRLQRDVTGGKPIQLMTHRELELLGLTNLADAVKKFAGASVKDYGGIGGMKTVSVRNLGAHHTAVSYDGVTISNTQAGQIDIGRYQTDNIQELSLAMGEEDDQMQSARHYASAGVLSITTEQPYYGGERRRFTPHFKASLRGGSWGLVSPSLRLTQSFSERTAVSLGGTYMRADGVYPFTLKNGRMRTREKRYNSDIESWQGEANLYNTLADNSQLDVKAYWYRSERGLPGAVILYNDKSDERLWDEDFFTQAVWRKRFNQQWSLHARVKYAHSWNRYEDTDVKYQDGKLTDVARQNEYYASATVGWTPIDNLTFALAEDIAFNDLRSNISISDNLNNPPYPKRTTSLTALSARYAWQRLTLNANVVGTYATEKVKAGKQPDDRRRLSPSASLSYRVLANEALYIRPMYKSTQHRPAPGERQRIQCGDHVERTARKVDEIPVGDPRRLLQRCNRQDCGLPFNLCMEDGQLWEGVHSRHRCNDGHRDSLRQKSVAAADRGLHLAESGRPRETLCQLWTSAAVYPEAQRQRVAAPLYAVGERGLQPSGTRRKVELSTDHAGVSSESICRTIRHAFT